MFEFLYGNNLNWFDVVIFEAVLFNECQLFDSRGLSYFRDGPLIQVVLFYTAFKIMIWLASYIDSVSS